MSRIWDSEIKILRATVQKKNKKGQVRYEKARHTLSMGKFISLQNNRIKAEEEKITEKNVEIIGDGKATWGKITGKMNRPN